MNAEILPGIEIVFESNNTATLINCSNAVGDIRIPRSFENESQKYNITTIGENSFKEAKRLTKLSFSEDSVVATIEKNAFKDSSISQLSLPPKLEHLDEGWCSDIRYLNEIRIPESNHPKFQLIDNKYLVGSTLITKNFFCNFVTGNCLTGNFLYGKDGLINKFNELFFACRNITEAKIPKNICIINSFAFQNCNELKFLSFLGNEIEEIRREAFEGCTNLSNLITFPSSLEKIGYAAFKNDEKLKQLRFQSDEIIFEPYCFQGCTNLKNIETNASKIVIKQFAFDEGVTLVHKKNAQITGQEYFKGTIVEKSSIRRRGIEYTKSEPIQCKRILEGANHDLLPEHASEKKDRYIKYLQEILLKNKIDFPSFDAFESDIGRFRLSDIGSSLLSDNKRIQNNKNEDEKKNEKVYKNENEKKKENENEKVYKNENEKKEKGDKNKNEKKEKGDKDESEKKEKGDKDENEKKEKGDKDEKEEKEKGDKDENEKKEKGDKDVTNYKPIEMISQTEAYCIWAVSDIQTNQKLNKLILKPSKDLNASSVPYAMVQEFDFLRLINHPCICKVYYNDTCDHYNFSGDAPDQESDKTFSFYFEYMPQQLKFIVSDNLKIDNTIKTKIAIEILYGMIYLQKMGINHDGLTIDNIFLYDDFATSKIMLFSIFDRHKLEDDTYNKLDNFDLQHSQASYAYSYGTILYELFANSNFEDYQKENQNDLEPSESISSLCIDLIKKCLSPDLSIRPSLEVMLIIIRQSNFRLAEGVNTDFIYQRISEIQNFEKRNPPTPIKDLKKHLK